MSAKKNTPVVISDEHNEVKIYTVKGRTGSFYQLCFYRCGDRIRKTFADLNEAKREARMQLGQLAGERLQARNLSAIEMESFTIAARTTAPTGLPLHVCAELFTEAHRVLNGRSVVDAANYYMKHNDPMRPRKPLRVLAGEFIDSRRTMGVSADYLYHTNWAMNSFIDAFGGTALDDLVVGDLDRWLESRTHLKNRSRNTCRVILICFGNFLKKRGYLPGERKTVFDGMCVLKNEISPVTLYTSEEMRALLDKANAALLPYLAIGAFAGLRSAEIMRLDWKHIRFDRGFIECEASMTKTRRRRLVPLSDNLRAWLEPLAQHDGRVAPYSDVSTVVCEFGHKIGIKWKRNALRHSYISYRLAVVPDTARVALECGNSPEIIFQHYRELTTPKQGQDWFHIVPPADYPQCLNGRRSKAGRKAGAMN